MLLFLSCRNQKTGENDIISEEYFAELPSEPLSSEVLPVSNEHLISVYNLLLYGDKLILCKAIPNPLYYEVYDTSDWTYLGDFGREGNGPGEFVGLLRSNIADKDRGIMGVFTKASGNHYYEIDIDSALTNSDYVSKLKVKIDIFGSTRLEMTNNRELVVMSVHSEKRISLIDLNGKLIGEYFSYPFEEKMADYPKELYGMVYQSKMVRNHSYNLIGVFDMSTPNWDIMDMTHPPKVIHSTHLRPLSFKNDSRITSTSKSYSIIPSADNKEAFIDVTANDEFIYALYSGKSYAKHGFDDNFCNTVLVFNWDGKIVRKIKLKYNSQIIQVDEDNHFLYSVVEGRTKDELIRYKL